MDEPQRPECYDESVQCQREWTEYIKAHSEWENEQRYKKSQNSKSDDPEYEHDPDEYTGPVGGARRTKRSKKSRRSKRKTRRR